MDNKERICGLYLRVSTEDQAREGFSLREQKERLEAYCKFKGYEIVDYYEDAGVSAKTGNYRAEFERLKDDIKSKKIKGNKNCFPFSYAPTTTFSTLLDFTTLFRASTSTTTILFPEAQAISVFNSNAV